MSGFKGWRCVAEQLEARVAEAERQSDKEALLDEGQRASVRVIAERLCSGHRAILVADEVGMGKTRIAVALIDAVRRCGGTAAIVLPAGLGAQWQAELRLFDPNDHTLLPLRSYESFVRGFSREGDDDLSSGWQERRDARLRDRRQQRELPVGAWQDEKVLMVSHAFARMAFPLPENGELPWRRELMPAMAALCSERRRNIRKGGRGERLASHRAARAAYETLSIQSLEIEQRRDWRLVSSDDYRRAVLPVIGRALGRFDLVVIDEAHKARCADSSLSRILGSMIWESEDSFRLGMTATPVELDADQWLDTLGRLVGRKAGFTGENEGEHWDRLSACISDYARIAEKVRTEPLDNAIVTEFEKASKRFVDGLSCYVIRRDKRSDKELKAFWESHGIDYRDVRSVSVDPARMGSQWLRMFCAAEALSLLPETDRDAKRRRLTLEKAHALDKILLEDATEGGDMLRDFWSRKVLLSKDVSIFDHPAILAAVRTVEAATAEGRKVLIFGTLIEPLKALTRLLDARCMLRHLAEGRHWPASRVPADSEHAVQAALRSSDRPAGVPDDLGEINLMLKDRYDEAQRKRDARLRKMRNEIQTRAERGQETASLLWKIWLDGDTVDAPGESRIGLLIQALESRTARGSHVQAAAEPPDWTTDDLLEETDSLLRDLMAGSVDDHAEDVPENSGDPHPSRLQLLLDHLSDFSGREGSFARLLYGQTAPRTRRLLQAAFNRAGSWPFVLVAQSLVGREGLNLHEECRTVVLLHAEWNPGVVEQQIGRVDRKNSRFLKDYRSGTWRENGNPPPRIEIHCIQIAGGYDSFHWSVFRERWASLRAQLHGVVVATTDRERVQNDCELAALVARLDRAAPNFYPAPKAAAWNRKEA